VVRYILKGGQVMSEFYTTKEIAELFKVTEKTVRDTINKGHIEAYKFGKEWRISKEALQKFLEANRNIN
jgi:excisionase family DNA binding protein